MSETVKNRIEALRSFMRREQLHAFIVPSSDIHLSEYPSEHWKSREWISGFTGSAGTIVVTLDKAGLWTDSRYFLQAEKELAGSGICLFKDRLPETPSIAEWLSNTLSAGEVVGLDGTVNSARDVLALQQVLQAKNLTLDTTSDPFAEIWTDRPPVPMNPVFGLPEQIAGKSVSEKIAEINSQLNKLAADSLLIASLDTVAWLFNLRGNDVEYNPVFISFAYVSAEETVLFIFPEKIDTDIINYLKKEGVVVAHYSKIVDYINQLNGKTICLQGDKISYSLYHHTETHNKIKDTISPADLLKAQKNETELSGFRSAMQKDGVALVRFFRWLEEAVPLGNVTEHSVAEKLVEFRSQQDLFVGESFGTIAGFQGNGAIIHYHADKQHASKIANEGFLLIDSGAQYFDGTTDITRTVALGPLSEEMKKDYTLVLKGNIALASAVFPAGTRGTQLDVLARQFLWKEKVNYLYGTGHGIGHFLNVHEGPQSIRMEENPVKLEKGMILSNEPGVYRTGKYGIRIENLMTIREEESDCGYGIFYNFETLTLCPIDTTPVVTEMMNKQEIDWLNEYHQKVFELLSPGLTTDETEWLKAKTSPL